MGAPARSQGLPLLKHMDPLGSREGSVSGGQLPPQGNVQRYFSLSQLRGRLPPAFGQAEARTAT